MTHDPMLRPDSLNRKPSWGERRVQQKPTLFPVERRNELTDVAKTLAAHGGGAVAFDLALDLVLNEVVEQARTATNADGAAIALARDGEMECRATTGPSSPGLGVRVESTSGLSGACLQTGQIQHCTDSEIDERVDAEACRELGLRSILVMPLADEDRPFGIIEVLSSQPHAFDKLDIEALRKLSLKIVASKREAEQGAKARLEPISEPSIPEAELAGSADKPTSSSVIHEELFADDPPHGRNDIWTNSLVVLVIVAAVSLGVLIGWHGATRKLTTAPPQRNAAAASKTTGRETGPQDQADVSSASSQLTTTNAPSSSIPPAKSPTKPAQKPAGPPDGGLVVTEDGKVIYRLPTAPKSPGSGTKSEAEVPSTRVIYRVNPEYPSEAKARNIQGTVVLDAQVLDNCSVGDVAVVKGDPLLTEAAVHAVRQWKYQPYLVDGRPVESQTRITINFALPSSR
jgi:TonB family protein